MTPEQIARAYAETIYGPANAWGQHVHPTLGISHAIMWQLQQTVGETLADVLIDQAMAEYRYDRDAKNASRIADAREGFND